MKIVILVIEQIGLPLCGRDVVYKNSLVRLHTELNSTQSYIIKVLIKPKESLAAVMERRFVTNKAA